MEKGLGTVGHSHGHRSGARDLQYQQYGDPHYSLYNDSLQSEINNNNNTSSGSHKMMLPQPQTFSYHQLRQYQMKQKKMEQKTSSNSVDRRIKLSAYISVVGLAILLLVIVVIVVTLFCSIITVKRENFGAKNTCGF